MLAAGAFVTAAVLSYRELHYNSPNDLRSPMVLAVDALMATAVAFGFAVHEGSLTRWTDAHLCLRFGLWTAGVLSHPAGKTTIKLAVPKSEQDGWRRLWEKILSPFPNCNAEENQPAFTSQSL